MLPSEMYTKLRVTAAHLWVGSYFVVLVWGGVFVYFFWGTRPAQWFIENVVGLSPRLPCLHVVFSVCVASSSTTHSGPSDILTFHVWGIRERILHWVNHDFKYSDCSETLSWVFDFSIGFSLCCWITRCLPHAARCWWFLAVGAWKPWCWETTVAGGARGGALACAFFPGQSAARSASIPPDNRVPLMSILASCWHSPSTFLNKIGVYWRNKLLCCKNGIFLTSVLHMV